MSPPWWVWLALPLAGLVLGLAAALIAEIRTIRRLDREDAELEALQAAVVRERLEEALVAGRPSTVYEPAAPVIPGPRVPEAERQLDTRVLRCWACGAPGVGYDHYCPPPGAAG